MRLVCPNCGAQYEVDDRVIPDSGRDVQCSSCGHAWYQMPAGMESAEEPAPEDFETGLDPDDDAGDDIGEDAGEDIGEGPDGYEPEAEPEPEPEPEPVTEPLAAAEPSEPEMAPEEPDLAAAGTEGETGEAPDADSGEAVTGDAYDEDEDEETGPPPGLEGMVAPKRDLDQNLRAILQEEVAREMAARAADTGPSVIETAPSVVAAEAPDEADEDLQLIREPSKPFDDALADIGPAPTNDRVDVFASEPGLAAAPDKGSRKDLFPDIDEINSTLDSHGPDSDEDEMDGDDERSGFGRAFFTVIAIAALLLALYLVAPKLAASIPALEPVLSGYVGLINGLRGIFGG